MKMRAALVDDFGPPGRLQIRDVERPSVLRADELLVHVHAAGVNYADTMLRRGAYPNGPKPPYIPGLDVAGVVERIGDDVTVATVGQHVMAFTQARYGGYCEYTVVRSADVFVLDSAVDLIEAASWPTATLAAYFLVVEIGKMQRAERVLVHSASGAVGLTIIQLAKYFGAKTIIGTVGNRNKTHAPEAAGADYCAVRTVDDFVALANEATSGHGVDLLWDPIGGEVGEQSLSCLADQGRMITFGMASGAPSRLLSSDFYYSCRTLVGFSLGTLRREQPHRIASVAPAWIKLLRDGVIRLPYRTMPLEACASAHEQLESGSHIGKVILTL